MDQQNRPKQERHISLTSRLSPRLISFALTIIAFLVFMQSLPRAIADPSYSARRAFGDPTDNTWSLAVGDIDGDGSLDLIVGNMDQQNVVYLNDGLGNFYSGPVTCGVTGSARCFGPMTGATRSVAVGDMNGDGALDVVVGNDAQQNAVYLNDGVGNFYFGAVTCGVTLNVRCFGNDVDPTRSIAIGDINGDGSFDLVVGNEGQQDLVYLNNGVGNFYTGTATCGVTPGVRCFGTGNDATMSVAVGDINQDGSLDLIAGNLYEQNVGYLNNGAGSFHNGSVICGVTTNVRCFGPVDDATFSVAVGDMDNDGSLDLVVGNMDEQNVVYVNDGSGNFYYGLASCDTALNLYCFGIGSDDTYNVAVGDADADGDLDIGVGNYRQGDVVYLNDDDGSDKFHRGSVTCYLSLGVRCFGPGSDRTRVVALGDMNGDGFLDAVAGNNNRGNFVYLNDGIGHFHVHRNFGTGPNMTRSVAVGDVNGDGSLDIVVGNRDAQSIVYLNDGSGNFHNGAVVCGVTPGIRCFGAVTDLTYSVAVGDLNGDGALDIVAGNYGQQNVVYLNDGEGNFYFGSVSCGVIPDVKCFGTGDDTTLRVVSGDINGDGALDIVVGNDGQQNAVYLNDGAGDFNLGLFDCGTSSRVYCVGPANDATYSLAVADLDDDSDLDLAVGNLNQQNVVYLNDGAGHFYNGPVTCGMTPGVRCFGTGSDPTRSVIAGDVNNDDRLDLVVGNDIRQSAVYFNDGLGSFYSGSVICGVTDGVSCFGLEGYSTYGMAVADIDGNGSLDLISGNNNDTSFVFLNDGHGRFYVSSVRCGDTAAVRCFGRSSDYTRSVAIGDLDRDGDLDIVSGNDGLQNIIYMNLLSGSGRLPNNPPHISLTRPGITGDADFYSTPNIISAPFVSITYAISDTENDSARAIHVYYSDKRGGQWLPAVAATGTVASDALPPGTHIFSWDTLASGLFGQSDDVVLRMEVFPSFSPTPNGSAGPYQRPYLSATTFPFRLRGTQVRVISSTQPISSSMVYRLPISQTFGALPFRNLSSEPFHTDSQGYLQGRGRIDIGDRLIALLPITATDTYTLYFTSAVPSPTGLSMYTVIQAGVQTLTVSAANPLILFNLDVSLEWDARNDAQFMSQLSYDLQRTSELLYDWTNGQAALGPVSIYHDREHWLDADVRIYATNRMRPNAAQGGIVSTVITDPLTSTVTYEPGQARMGAIWNRYGDASGTLGEDWPRALAHELGHYALFLDDDYLGQDANGLLIPIDTCTGTAMSDPYRDDYSELHYQANWSQDCANTLAARETGRWDWATVSTFYPWLNDVITNTGPSGLPLAVTQIKSVEPITSPTALAVPIFYLSQNGGHVEPGSGARAFLFHTDAEYLTDLGSPILDQVMMRGARLGDRLCVFELGVQRSGCETLTPGDDQLALIAQANWQPDIIMTPITSRTLAITVTNVPSGLSLSARLYSTDSTTSPTITLNLVGNQYAGVFYLAEPSLEGYLHVWVNEPAPRREIVTDYSIGGTPARMKGHWARMKAHWVPGASSDGQIILYSSTLYFTEGEMIAFQSATTLPSVPIWATPVGHGYRLTASASAPDLSGASISLYYAGRDVPPGGESWLRVYFWNGATWRQLPTQLDIYHNFASAPAQGPGLYVLMASLEIPLYGPGWDLFAYPVQATPLVTQALASIDGAYSTVYWYDGSDSVDPWKVYDVSVPLWVNDLSAFKFGEAYWISLTQSITLSLNGGATASPNSALNIQSPPATYYGTIFAGPGFTPTVGMSVTAWINGKLCGQSNTFQESGALVYSINVLADGPGGATGCGAPGRYITFVVDGQSMLPHAEWNNDQIWNVPLSPNAISSLVAMNSSPTLVGQTTWFTATATGNDITYTWNFSDGSATTTGANTSHTYASIGLYTARVTATNSISSVAATTPVAITDVPISGLSATSSSPQVLGSSTAFTATIAAGTNVSYLWNFGDGNSTVGQTASHTYLAVGNYVAIVTATNSVPSTASAATAITITKATPLVAITSDTPDPSVVGQSVGIAFAVTPSGAGTPTGVVTVTDGTQLCTATLPSTTCSIVFTSAGAKSLTAQYSGNSNFNGATSVSTAHTVNKAGTTTSISSIVPSPALFGQSTAITASLIVNAPGAGTPTGVITVTDGTVSCTTTLPATACSLIFNVLGSHTITATYSGDANFNGSSGTSPLTVNDVPISDLTAQNSSPTQLGSVTFFAATILAGTNVSYEWNFGDGSAMANGADASHTYGAIGTYTASITATNSVSSITATTWVTITDVPISDLMARNSSPTVIGNSTAFTATVGSGSSVVYHWNFGDGSTPVNGANPYHIYAAVGVYSALVTATNSLSIITMTTPVMITATQPVADAGPDQTVKSQSIVALDGSASFDPNNFLPLTYGWVQSGGPAVVLSSGALSRPIFNAPAVVAKAQLTFTLVVTNIYGLISTPDTIVISVQPYTCFLPLVQK